MSGNAPICIYTRLKNLTRYPVSIISTSRSSVGFGGMGWEPHCEQLLIWYFWRGEHPLGGRSPGNEVLKCSPI